MSEHAITAEMIEAASETLERIGLEFRGDPDLTETEIFAAVYSAMESARLEGEEAARQERMKARQS